MKRHMLSLILALAVVALAISSLAVPTGAAQAQNFDTPLVIGMAGDLWSYSELTGTLTQLTLYGLNGIPMLAPNGRVVAYSSVADFAAPIVRQTGDTPNIPPSNIWLWDLPSGRSARIADQPAGASFNTSGPNFFIRRSGPAWSLDGQMIAWTEQYVSSNQSGAFELVIYDAAQNAVRARTPLNVAGVNPADILGAGTPKWGRQGVAVELPIGRQGGVFERAYQIYDTRGVLRREFRRGSGEGPLIFDFYWVNQQNQEYVGVLYANGNWVLLNPVDGTQFPAPGLPELINAVAPNGVSAFLTPGADNVRRWTANWNGSQFPLSFNGTPQQISIAPNGQAIAYVADGVYIVRGEKAARVPGSERILSSNVGAYVAWSFPAWRMNAGAVPPPPPPTAPPVVVGCANTPPTRMYIGLTARVTAFPSQSNALNSGPGRPSRNPTYRTLTNIPVGGVFTVLNGPVCADGYQWWQVNYNGIVGWTAEGEGNVYWIEPYTVDSGAACPPNLPARLQVGALARVTPGEANALRSHPSRNPALSAIVGSIPGSATFTVLSGPVCADGYAWWQVNYNGLVGWTAEGEGVTYWLEPLICGFAAPSRLQVGGRGRVTLYPPQANAVRSQPSRNNQISAILGEIPPGGVFNVLQGPQCADGLAWWLVNYRGLVGWTPEGENSTYWLEPVR